MSDKYIEVDGVPLPEKDVITWARWFETHDRHVADTRLSGDVRVSTVFLGLDHQWNPRGGTPILYETMIFGGPHEGFQERYATRSEAEAGHAAAVKLADVVTK